MEVDVVLAHELIKTDVLLVEPPFLPVGCQVCGDTGISNGGIKLQSRVSIDQGLSASKHTQTSDQSIMSTLKTGESDV